MKEYFGTLLPLLILVSLMVYHWKYKFLNNFIKFSFIVHKNTAFAGIYLYYVVLTVISFHLQ